MILFFIPYGIVNHLPIERYVVPFVFGENHIPFLPWTFIIYVSAFVQAFFIIRFIPKHFLPRIIALALCMLSVGILFFILFPIEYPRALYPTDNTLITFFRTIDTPGNCFPSLHVSLAILLAALYIFLETRTIRKIFMCIWTLLIICSVLTTKQHHVIDIIGGALLAIPFVFMLRKNLLKEELT